MVTPTGRTQSSLQTFAAGETKQAAAQAKACFPTSVYLNTSDKEMKMCHHLRDTASTLFRQVVGDGLLILTLMSTVCVPSFANEPNTGAVNTLPTTGLLCDLNADLDVHADDIYQVYKWENQAVAKNHPGRDFVEREYANRKSPESRPRWQKNNRDLNGHHSLVFYGEPADGSHLGDDLININGGDVYDHLTQGSGHTWLAVIKPYRQYSPIKGKHGEDINIFFGNLRNGSGCRCDWCGFWGGISKSSEDELFYWAGARSYDAFKGFNGTIGHYRSDGNPHIFGRRLVTNQWTIVGARMNSGKGKVKIEVFQGMTATPVNEGDFWVDPGSDVADPDVMAIGTERDAENHPGKESFDGEIARLLIWERPLSVNAMDQAVGYLKDFYFE